MLHNHGKRARNFGRCFNCYFTLVFLILFRFGGGGGRGVNKTIILLVLVRYEIRASHNICYYPTAAQTVQITVQTAMFVQ